MNGLALPIGPDSRLDHLGDPKWKTFGPVRISAFDSLPDATNLGGIDG